MLRPRPRDQRARIHHRQRHRVRGGEYAPGTLVGDALLAHELAHVAQQDGATEVMTKSDAASAELEHDADNAAVGAVLTLWPKLRHWARDVRANAMPRLKSSLRLQSCDPTMAEKRGYLGGIDVANKPLTAGDSAERARFVVKDWREASPEFLLTIRRKIVIIRQLLASGSPRTMNSASSTSSSAPKPKTSR